MAGAFGGFTLTKKGADLLAKAQAGAELQFTKMEVGDGSVPGGTDLSDMAALVSPKIDLSLNKLQALSGRYTTLVGAAISNVGLETGFYLRELGIFAQDPDEGEILYVYANAGTTAEFFPPEGTAKIEKQMDARLALYNATNVTITSDESLVFVDLQTYNQFVSDTNSKIGDIQDLQTTADDNLVDAINEVLTDLDSHIGDNVKHITAAERTAWNAKETPEGAQIKADDAETSAKNYTNTLTGLLSNLTTEQKANLVAAINELVTKVGTAQSDINSHEALKNNPHEVTKSQVGLGNLQNYGIATQSEAEAGASGTKYMTPQRTKQYVDTRLLNNIRFRSVNGGIEYSLDDGGTWRALGIIPVGRQRSVNVSAPPNTWTTVLDIAGSWGRLEYLGQTGTYGTTVQYRVTIDGVEDTQSGLARYLHRMYGGDIERSDDAVEPIYFQNSLKIEINPGGSGVSLDIIARYRLKPGTP